MADEDQVESGGKRSADALVYGVVVLGLAVLLAAFLIAPRPGNQGFLEPAEVLERQANRARTHTLVCTAVYAFAFAILLAWAQPPQVVEDELADAEPLCVSCFEELPPGVTFCPYCGAPASVIATHGGIEYVYSQAWCLGRAAHGPNRPLQVVGVSLITLPYLVGAIGMLFAASHVGSLAMGGAVVQGLFHLVIYGMILVRCVANLDSADPDELDPARGPYGSPPWWSFDTRWARSPSSEEQAG